MVLLRTSGMHGKLEEAWEGPYEILQQLYSVNVRLGMPGRGKKTKVVHLIVPYVASDVRVCRMVW